MKTCTKCNENKPLSEFNKNKRQADGVQTCCRMCQKALNRQSYLKSPARRKKLSEQGRLAKLRGKAFVQRYKRFCGCRVCGESEPIALDLHHLDPSTKEGNPANLYGNSFKTIKREIRKCVVLCANCHRKVHAGIITLP